MSKYAFILGHRPLLSLAEIEAYLATKKIGWRPSRWGNGVLVVDFDKNPAAPQEMLNQLGGTIKIIQILAESPSNLVAARERISQELTAENLLAKYLTPTEKKVLFGFSLYSLSEKLSGRDLQIFLRTYGIDIKRDLKKKSINSRFVVGREPELSSVIIAKNKLLSRGAAIDIIFDKQYLAWGKTVAIQDFEDYNLRDYGRPAADPKKGMLPPKVAQILINLARLRSGESVLDPFCGVGTILQEALLRDLKVSGTDIDPAMVAATKKNLDWLVKTYELEPGGIKKIDTADVKFVGKKFRSGSLDAIVTEATLGPPLARIPAEIVLQRNIKKLEKTFIDALKSTKQILKPRGLVVLTLPYYILPGKRVFMPILDNIKGFGYTLVAPFRNEVIDKIGVKPTERGSLLYERPRQIVGREVVILKKSGK